MLNEVIQLRNYAHLGDAVWEIFVREYVVFLAHNSKALHKMTTDRVNAEFQKNVLDFLMPNLTPDEQELARRGRNLPIPVGRKAIQKSYRKATALEVLVGYWYLHDKKRLNKIFDICKSLEDFS